jgi:AcrR family transcriptional regulator
MVYRRTERVAAQLAARQATIMAAARALARESGIAAVQIVPVAQRAGIASGTVYRYFPCKDDLVSAVVGAIAEEELAALRDAAAAAPGPLSALAAAIMTLSLRVLRERRLARALLADPGDSGAPAGRLAFRRSLASAFEELIRTAASARHLPADKPEFAAAALIGAILEGLVSPYMPDRDESGDMRGEAQAITLFGLRALGVPDARARGLVVQAG